MTEICDSLRTALNDPACTVEQLLAVADHALVQVIQQQQGKAGMGQLIHAHTRITESRFWFHGAMQAIDAANKPQIVVPHVPLN